MSKDYVHYMTVWFTQCYGTIVTHTCGDDEREIKVHFEQPDDKSPSKHLELRLHNTEIVQNDGFTNDEVKWLLEFSKNNFDLIMKYAKVGGVANA